MNKEEYNRNGVEKLKLLAREQFGADMEAVIRCMDCIWYQETEDNTKGYCEEHDATFFPLDFCSWGEEK